MSFFSCDRHSLLCCKNAVSQHPLLSAAAGQAQASAGIRRGLRFSRRQRVFPAVCAVQGHAHCLSCRRLCAISVRKRPLERCFACSTPPSCKIWCKASESASKAWRITLRSAFSTHCAVVRLETAMAP